MFGGKIGSPELLIVFAIAMLIFGPSKMVGLGKRGNPGIQVGDERGRTGRAKELIGNTGPLGSGRQKRTFRLLPRFWRLELARRISRFVNDQATGLR